MKYIEHINFTRPIEEYLKENLDRSLHHILDVLDASLKSKPEKDRIRKVILDEFNRYHRETVYVCKRIQEIIQDGENN